VHPASSSPFTVSAECPTGCAAPRTSTARLYGRPSRGMTISWGRMRSSRSPIRLPDQGAPTGWRCWSP